MEPRIVNRDKMTLVGMIYFGSNQHGEIPQLWDQFVPRMDRIPHRASDCTYGVCFNDSQADPGSWYVAGVEVSQVADIPPDMVAKPVPAKTYAVFTHRGPVSTIRETWERAYRWLPTSDYESDMPAYDFELYDERFNPADAARSECDIYITVRRKA